MNGAGRLKMNCIPSLYVASLSAFHLAVTIVGYDWESENYGLWEHIKMENTMGDSTTLS